MIKKISFTVIFSLLGIAGIAGADTNKASICHLTSSAKNPVVIISVSSNAVQAHLNHGDTLFPPDATDCSGGDPIPQ